MARDCLGNEMIAGMAPRAIEHELPKWLPASRYASISPTTQKMAHHLWSSRETKLFPNHSFQYVCPSFANPG